MDLLQILTTFFPFETPERAIVGADGKIKTICDTQRSLLVTARPEDIKSGIEQLYKEAPDEGMGTEDVVAHILQKIAPGLAAGQSGPR